MSHILFEPFRIKVVEPIRVSSRAERELWLKQAGYNVFNLRSEQVMIDLLSDSGTAAMSQEQWAALQSGDEAYAGSRSFFDLEATAKEIFGKKIIIPVHQGRAGEHLVFSVLVHPGDVVPNNSHFDTTGANVADNGGIPLNLPIPELKHPRERHPFKGNMDLKRLEDLLKSGKEKVPFVMVTITNNSGGGQPVSLENIKGIHSLCRRFSKPLIIDACRFAENAMFIKKREAGQAGRSAKEIAQEILSLGSIITFSGKKDALANIGGLVCLDDPQLAEQLKNRLIVTEGFTTYGGLAGRDLAAMAQGLREVLDEDYLTYRLRTIEWMVEKLNEKEVPVLVPAGGHAIYLDADAFFPKIPPEQFPGIALTAEAYLRGGIRGVELGNVAFGSRDQDGKNIFPALDLVRFAMPRRVYTEAHAGFVVDTLIEAYQERDQVKGFRFDYEAPVMRHFRSTFARQG
jgi:tryptophanase